MANVWSKTSKELNLVSIATNIKRIKVNARWRSPRDTRSGTDLACNFSVPLQYIQIIFPFHLIFQRHVLQPSELSFYLGISYFWSAFLSCAHWLSCLYFICPIFPLGLCLSSLSCGPNVLSSAIVFQSLLVFTLFPLLLCSYPWVFHLYH